MGRTRTEEQRKKMSGNMKVFVAMLATCLVLGLLVSMAAAAKKKNQEPHYKNGEHNDAAHADDDKLSSADFIKKAIAEHDVVIFSKSYCPYCKRAKQLFTNENIPFHAVELDLHPNGGDIQKALQDWSENRPQHLHQGRAPWWQRRRARRPPERPSR